MEKQLGVAGYKLQKFSLDFTIPLQISGELFWPICSRSVTWRTLARSEHLFAKTSGLRLTGGGFLGPRRTLAESASGPREKCTRWIPEVHQKSARIQADPRQTRVRSFNSPGSINSKHIKQAKSSISCYFRNEIIYNRRNYIKKVVWQLNQARVTKKTWEKM